LSVTHGVGLSFYAGDDDAGVEGPAALNAGYTDETTPSRTGR
jgi:hypothetical protein